MRLSKEQTSFVKQNSKILEQIFNTRLDEIMEQISSLPSGAERDIKLEFWKEYKSWLNSIGIIKENPVKTSREFV